MITLALQRPDIRRELPVLPILLALILRATNDWHDHPQAWGGLVEGWGGQHELWAGRALHWGTDE